MYLKMSDFSQPSYRRKDFEAERVFTDREEPCALFETALNEPQGPSDWRVLTFYGLGGQGKSALFNHFRSLLRDKQQNQRHASSSQLPVTYAEIDFDANETRRVDQALLKLRIQLQKNSGIRFPTFDFAFARYFALTSRGIDIRQQHPELFRGDNEILEDLLSVVEAGMSLIPGLSLAFKYVNRFGNAFKAWWERRGRKLLVGIDEMSEAELLETLPTYFAADLSCAVFGDEPTNDTEPQKRVVLLFDTYEKLWEARVTKTGLGALRVDSWMQTLVKELPGVLFVILGRNRLRWDELDERFNAVLNQHLLDSFTEDDADRFLRNVPIIEEPIRQVIVASSAGLPFYLNLQVTSYETLRNQGKQPKPEDFGGGEKQIISRFLEHLERHIIKALRVIAHARYLDNAVFHELEMTFLAGLHVSFNELAEHAHMQAATETPGRFAMHDLMREYLLAEGAENEPQLSEQIHRHLFRYYSRKAKAKEVREISPSHEAALLEAAYHLEAASPLTFARWINLCHRTYYQAAKYNLLEPLLERALSIQEETLGNNHLATATTLYNLARIGNKQGKYREAEELYRRAVAIREKLLGSEHPRSAAALSELAGVLSNQARYREAEPLLRQALIAQIEELGENSPSVATTLSELGVLLNGQGKTAQAESLHRRALKISEKCSDPISFEVSRSLQNLAGILRNKGELVEAQELYERALSIRKQVYGKNHPKTALTLHNMAFVFRDQKDFVKAEAFLRRALEIRMDVLGSNHPSVASTLNALGRLLRTRTRYEEADALLKEALEIRINILGERHPRTANTLREIALLREQQGRYAEVEALCRKAFNIRKEVYGDEDRRTLKIKEHLERLQRFSKLEGEKEKP